MSRNTSKIDITHTDESINRILHRHDTHIEPRQEKYSCRYNQNEDQFILLERFLTVPSLPVHHSITNPEPPSGYTDMIAELCASLMDQCPELAADTTWYFDPMHIHAPSFYRIMRFEERFYLYHLLIDLACRPLESEIIEQGTNNRTHEYRTKHLYFESDYYPLAGGDITDGSITFEQTIPVTWKGEAGEGYMVHGIWMDADINKFFSKLVLPLAKRNHPYYPITCKQHCVSMNAFGQSGPALLHRVRSFIEPSLDVILRDLQSAPFSELMPLFKNLKAKISPELGERWKNLTVQARLNDQDQKEYIVEF